MKLAVVGRQPWVRLKFGSTPNREECAACTSTVSPSSQGMAKCYHTKVVAFTGRLLTDCELQLVSHRKQKLKCSLYLDLRAEMGGARTRAVEPHGGAEGEEKGREVCLCLTYQLCP